MGGFGTSCSALAQELALRAPMERCPVLVQELALRAPITRCPALVQELAEEPTAPLEPRAANVQGFHPFASWL